MDTSNPAVFVNAELLRAYMGRRVRTVIQVIRSDGGVVIGKSCDDQQIVVKGQLPAPLTSFVEVIGIADRHQSIRSEIGTIFAMHLICGTITSFANSRMESIKTCSYKEAQ